jgi:hypothetical protein
MSEPFKYVFLYKKGSASPAGIRDLRKAGFTCVEITGEFKDITFRAPVGSFAFEDDVGDMQLMVLKAALDSYSFGDKLGALVTKALKARLQAAEQAQVSKNDRS